MPSTRAPRTRASARAVTRTGLPARLLSTAATTFLAVWALLIPERLGRVDPRRADRRAERREQRGGVHRAEDDREVRPRHHDREVVPARLAPDVVDDVDRDDQREQCPDDDGRQGDEGRLDEEADLDHSAPKSQRPEDPDLLPALDNRPRADYAERGDADDQAQTHEALDQPVEGPLDRDRVLEQLFQRVGLEPVRDERRLELRRNLTRVSALGERVVVG